jgi:hypothetical protein
MRTDNLIGVLLFGLGGGLLLYSISYVVRDAVVTENPLSPLSFGAFTGGISFLIIGLGLNYILEARKRGQLTA